MQTSSLVLTFLVMHVVVCHDNSDDGDDNYYVNVRMPGIIVNSAEEYFCAPQVLAQSDAYIVAFDVDTKPNTAHHILLYGCESPFSEGRYWKGTMGQPCGNGLSQILFGWALNAPPFHLPEGVGFWVGPAAKIGYLVVQIHYGAQLSEPNYSGIRVKLTRSKPKFAAGIYLFTLWPSPPIPARTPRFTVDTSCQFDGPVPIRPFAFRPHAHTLGRSIMAYLHNQTVRSSPTNATDWQGLDGWYLIGKGDPRLPETFYPTASDGLVIWPGDHVFGRCLFNSSERNRPTNIGATSLDEMCNFYMMFYVDIDAAIGKDAARFRMCTTNIFPDEWKKVPTVGQLDPDAPPLQVATGSSHHHPSDHSSSSAESPMPDHSGMSHAAVTEMSAQSTDFGDSGEHHVEGHDSHATMEAWLDLDGVKHLQVDTFWSRAVAALQLGPISGTAIGPQGSIYLLHRADRVWDGTTFLPDNTIKLKKPISAETIVRVNDQGTVIERLGADLFWMPHSIAVDDSFNLYVTDVGLHQVIKLTRVTVAGNNTTDSTLYNYKYEVAWKFGSALKPGDGSTGLCKPSGLAVRADGTVFVADGYCNNRVVQLNAQGGFVRDWPSNGPATPASPSINSLVPHSVALADNFVCVANREISQLTCFNTNGELMHRILFGQLVGIKLFAIAFAQGYFFAVDGDASQTHALGFTLRLSDARIVDYWNLNDSRLYSNRTVSRVVPFGMAHAVATARDASYLVVVELNPARATLLRVVRGYQSVSSVSTTDQSSTSSDVIYMTQFTSWITQRTGLPSWAVLSIAFGVVIGVALVGVAFCTLIRRCRGGHVRGRRTIKASTQLLDSIIDQHENAMYVDEPDNDADDSPGRAEVDRHMDESDSHVRLNGKSGIAHFDSSSNSSSKRFSGTTGNRRSFLLKSKFRSTMRSDGFQPLSQTDDSYADADADGDGDEDDDGDEQDTIVDTDRLRQSNSLRSTTGSSFHAESTASHA